MNSRAEMNSRLLTRVENELHNLRRGQEDLNLRLSSLYDSVQELRELQSQSQTAPALASWSTLPDRMEEMEQQIKRMDHRLRETSVMVARTLPLTATPAVTKTKPESLPAATEEGGKKKAEPKVDSAAAKPSAAPTSTATTPKHVSTDTLKETSKESK